MSVYPAFRADCIETPAMTCGRSSRAVVTKNALRFTMNQIGATVRHWKVTVPSLGTRRLEAFCYQWLKLSNEQANGLWVATIQSGELCLAHFIAFHCKLVAH